MFGEERIRLIRFLTEHGINAYSFSDAEIRQKAQRIQSEQKLKSSGLEKGKKKPGQNKLATKKNPGNNKSPIR